MNANETLLWTRVVPLASVVGIAAGQLLFKKAAVLMTGPESWRSIPALAVLGAALAIYGCATLAWIGALRYSTLSAIYPLMALSFVLVPLGSLLFFKEKISLGYWAGTALLILGLVVIGKTTGRLK